MIRALALLRATPACGSLFVYQQVPAYIVVMSAASF
jgi:hypothetical protein